MTKLVTVTANFIENPFPALAANYSGRVAPVNGALLTQSGTLTLKVSKLGDFTGKLRIGGDAYSIKGELLPDGTARLVIPRRKSSNLVLELALDLDPGDTGRIIGELTIDGAKLPISLDRELPFADPGNFTLALSPDPSLTFVEFPGGHGFGTATILQDGTVRFVNDCALILGAALLMAPFGFIPFSNTFPAIALLFLAIGSLQRDGLFILIGHVSNLVTIAYFALLIGGGGYALISFMQRLLP